MLLTFIASNRLEDMLFVCIATIDDFERGTILPAVIVKLKAQEALLH